VSEQEQFDIWRTERLGQQLDALTVRFSTLLKQRTGEKWHIYIKRSQADFIFGFLSKTTLSETMSWTLKRVAERWDNWIDFADAEIESVIRKWHLYKKLITDAPDEWRTYQKYIDALYEIAEHGDYDPYSEKVIEAGRKFCRESEGRE